MSRICANCGSELEDNALLCPACGAVGGGTADKEFPTIIIDKQNDEEIADVSGPNTETAETAVNKTAPRRYMVIVCVAVALLALIVILLWLKDIKDDENKKPSWYGYDEVLTEYFDAVCSCDSEERYQACYPQALIEYYLDGGKYTSDIGFEENQQLTIESYYDWLIDSYGEEPQITYTITNKEWFDATEYAEQYSIWSNNTIDFTTTDLYQLDLDISIEGSKRKVSGLHAQAHVLNINGQWVINYLWLNDGQGNGLHE